MRYQLMLVTRLPVEDATEPDTKISRSHGDFTEPLVPGSIVEHGGDTWRVDEVFASRPPSARLFRPPDAYQGSEPWAP